MSTRETGRVTFSDRATRAIRPSPRPLRESSLTCHSPLPAHGHALRPNEQVEEFYVLTWESPKEMIFEMPVRPSAENTKAAAIFFSLFARDSAPNRVDRPTNT